jgi:cardiolipin synthase
VRVEGARGALSRADSARILDDLARKAPAGGGMVERHLAIEEALTKTPLSLGNQVTLLEDGKATYAAMLQSIKAARQHVHVEMYIFEDDEVGRLFAAAMAERAKAGVRVRLIYDAVGSVGTKKEFFEELANTGVQVAAFNPVTVKNVLGSVASIQNRDHRKLVVVDGRVAFLGGINISNVYGSGSSRVGDVPFEERPWRDLQVRIEGPVVGDFQRAFVSQWEKVKNESLRETALYPEIKPAGKEMVRAVATTPSDKGLNSTYVALISAIEASEVEVLITMAYFVPHPELMGALEAAARRGVAVKMVLPSRSDNAVVYHAGRSYYDDLLEAGVRIFERKARVLHSKSAVVDGVWSTVGSTNLDWRSLVYNDELNAIVVGSEFARQMGAIFAKDLGNSEEITRQKWRERPFKDRVKESAARAWSQLL